MVVFQFYLEKKIVCDSLISDQHILIGTDEGIYTFNLNEIHENSMELVSAFNRPAFDQFITN